MPDARAHRQTAVTSRGPVSAFLRHHFRHFNAAALIDAATRLLRAPRRRRQDARHARRAR